jgi:hypothetical protein
MSTPRFALAPFVLALALLPLVSGSPVYAGGGSSASPGRKPAAQDPAVLGARYFDDAIRYVSRGGRGISRVQDFYAKLDAKLNLDEGQMEGQLRIWWQDPDRYRWELTSNNATTTKVLNANTGWMKTPDGRVQTLGRSSEGIRALGQLEQDRDRLSDVASFLAPETLKGPGVTFIYQGRRIGNGSYEGDWLKIVRKVSGKADITFWIAWTNDPKTGQVVGTWPGVVRVEGDPSQNIPTEDYILREWDSPRSEKRTFRYPRRIQGFAILIDPKTGKSVPQPFLTAFVDDIKINAGIDASRWAP